MLNQLIRLIKLEHPADHPEQAHEPACLLTFTITPEVYRLSKLLDV